MEEEDFIQVTEPEPPKPRFIGSIDKEFIVGLHLAANEILKSSWTDGFTDNYAGDPIRGEDGIIISIEPLEDSDKYFFPLTYRTELFLQENVITQEMLQASGVL